MTAGNIRVVRRASSFVGLNVVTSDGGNIRGKCPDNFRNENGVEVERSALSLRGSYRSR